MDVLLVTVAFILVFGGLIIWGMRRIGNRGVKLYQLGGDDSVNIQAGRDIRIPECTCYLANSVAPYWVNDKRCEMYYLNNGKWPDWCRGSR